jgi:hypothetical protein
LWAAIGLGALAIGLGIISIVAANWEDVTGVVRLAVHLALIAGLAVFLLLRGEKLEQDQPWGLEAGLFIFGMLGMTFFGHLGQVYQTGSPLWKPLAAWLVLFAPLLLLRGRSWLIASLLMVTAVYACWDYAWSFDGIFRRQEQPPHLLIALVCSLPILVAPFAAWMRSRSTREDFWKRLEQLGVIYAVAGTSILCIASGLSEISGSDLPFSSVTLWAGIALASGGLIVPSRPSVSGQSTAMVLAGAGIVAFLSYLTSGSSFMGGVLFLAFWAGIAGASLHAGWRRLFQLAVGVVALRLIVLSFELASDLLTSGAGLIIAGLLILGVAWGAVRINREYAPEAREMEASE